MREQWRSTPGQAAWSGGIAGVVMGFVGVMVLGLWTHHLNATGLGMGSGMVGFCGSVLAWTAAQMTVVRYPIPSRLTRWLCALSFTAAWTLVSAWGLGAIDQYSVEPTLVFVAILTGWGLGWYLLSEIVTGVRALFRRDESSQFEPPSDHPDRMP